MHEPIAEPADGEPEDRTDAADPTDMSVTSDTSDMLDRPEAPHPAGAVPPAPVPAPIPTPVPAPAPTVVPADIDRAFADLRAEGVCLAPDDEAVLGALLRDATSAASTTTGSEAAPFDAAAWLRAFLRTGVVRVPLGEAARGSRAGMAPALDLPHGADAWPGGDARSVELHRRTVDLMRADPSVDYATALARAHGGR